MTYNWLIKLLSLCQYRILGYNIIWKSTLIMMNISHRHCSRGGGLSPPTFFCKVRHNCSQNFFDKSSSPFPLFNFVSDTTVSWKKYCLPWKKFLLIYIYIFLCCFYYSAICYDVWRWMEQIWMVTPVWNSALSWSKGRFAWKADDWELVFLHHVFNILFHVLIMKKLYFEQEFLPLLST